MEDDDIIMNDSDVDAFIKDLSQDVTFDDESDLFETDFDENNELYDYETKGQELFDNNMYLNDTESEF